MLRSFRIALLSTAAAGSGLVLVAVAFAALAPAPLSADAASGAFQCHRINSQLESQVTATVPAITTAGAVQSGLLRGTSAFTATSLGAGPIAGTLAYGGDFSVTTKDGVLRTRSSGTFVPLADAPFSQFDTIDPAASEGIFAGATGTLFFYGFSTAAGDGFTSAVRGEVCLAR